MNEQETLKPYVIGLDLGGTNSVFGIVDSRGEIKATTAIKTQGYDRVEDYVNASVEALQIIIEQVGGIDKIKAMGIGAPNGNYYNGTIEFAPNLSWGHNGIVPLAKLFSDRLGIPVALTNDANAAAIGEMIYGVARGMKNFIVITLGTGVGSGSTKSIPLVQLDNTNPRTANVSNFFIIVKI
jgi:glucokinase